MAPGFIIIMLLDDVTYIPMTEFQLLLLSMIGILVTKKYQNRNYNGLFFSQMDQGCQLESLVGDVERKVSHWRNVLM
jgi:hypothetical protein